MKIVVACYLLTVVGWFYYAVLAYSPKNPAIPVGFSIITLVFILVGFLIPDGTPSTTITVCTYKKCYFGVNRQEFLKDPKAWELKNEP